MKKTNKKGFTLVELVIVIAVIAILAGVLIGTFASVISRANQSKAVQEWKAAIDASYVEYVADYHNVPTTVKIDGKGSIVFGDGEVSRDDKSFEALSLNASGSIELETGVFFNWKYDADNSAESGYTVGTSKEYNNLANSTTKSYMQDVVDKALVAGAKWYKLEQSNGAFTSIEFSADDSKPTEYTNGTAIENNDDVDLGAHNGKSWKATFTVDGTTVTAVVSVVTP